MALWLIRFIRIGNLLKMDWRIIIELVFLKGSLYFLVN